MQLVEKRAGTSCQRQTLVSKRNVRRPGIRSRPSVFFGSELRTGTSPVPPRLKMEEQKAGFERPALLFIGFWRKLLLALLPATARNAAGPKGLGKFDSRANLRRNCSFGPRTSYGSGTFVNSFSSKVIVAIRLARAIIKHIPEKHGLNGVNQV